MRTQTITLLFSALVAGASFNRNHQHGVSENFDSRTPNRGSGAFREFHTESHNHHEFQDEDVNDGNLESNLNAINSEFNHLTEGNDNDSFESEEDYDDNNNSVKKNEAFQFKEGCGDNQDMMWKLMNCVDPMFLFGYSKTN